MTTHYLMTVLAASPRIHAPALLSEVSTWLIRSVKWIAIGFTAGYLIWRKAAAWWAVLALLVLGIFVIPSTSVKVSQYTSDVSHGSAVGQTGASMGLLVLIAVLVAFTVFMERRDSGGGGEE